MVLLPRSSSHLSLIALMLIGNACARIGYEVLGDVGTSSTGGAGSAGTTAHAGQYGGTQPSSGSNPVGGAQGTGGAHYGGSEAGGESGSRGGTPTDSGGATSGFAVGGSGPTSSVIGGSATGGSGLGGSSVAGTIGGSAGGIEGGTPGTSGSAAGGIGSGGISVTGGVGPGGSTAGGAAAGSGVTGGTATAGAATGGVTASGGAITTGGAAPCNWTNGPPPFGKAKLLGAPNTSAWEGDPVISYDGLTLYFTRFNQSNYDVYFATRPSATGSFDAGTLPTAANSSSDEAHFFVGVSGLEAFVVSRRSGTADVFRATRASASATWGTFSALDSLDASSDEQDPHLEADQLTLWFARKGTGTTSLQYDIYYATRPDPEAQFETPTAATSLNSTGDESDVSLTHDCLVVVFLSTRDSTRRVYYAVRATRADAFGAPVPLTAFDTYSSQSLGNPFVAPDGCAIYFAVIPNGKSTGDMYVMEASP